MQKYIKNHHTLPGVLNVNKSAWLFDLKKGEQNLYVMFEISLKILRI